MQKFLYWDKNIYKAVPDSDCANCVFSKNYKKCALARAMVPCAKFKRMDMTNVIWVKHEKQNS